MQKKSQKTTRKVFKKRPCRLCTSKMETLDYKDAEFLGKFISDRGKIIPSRVSGCCQKHQRLVANRIKRARIAGLLPFVKVKQGAQRERSSYSKR